MFQMAPLVHAKLSKFNHGFTSNPIIIVISRLVSLTEDQANFLRNLSVRPGSIGDDKFVNIVYSSPESLLGNGYWRNMLPSDKI